MSPTTKQYLQPIYKSHRTQIFNTDQFQMSAAFCASTKQSCIFLCLLGVLIIQQLPVDCVVVVYDEYGSFRMSAGSAGVLFDV